jgi:aminopeptidase YwaD
MLSNRYIILVILALFAAGPIFPQQYNPYYGNIVSGVSYDTIFANLQHFQDLGVKEPGTAALNNTAEWLIGKYKSFGYTNIIRDTFELNGKQLYNITVTRQGTTFPPRYLIIDGHYDTYQGPGANDNGSGVTCILEIARLLASVPIKYSVIFINFSAEEQGLIGSQHYVDHTVVPSNMNILLVLNIDEVGGVAGMINNTITCERDEDAPSSNNAASAAFTDSLANLTELYSNLETQISYAYGSDYVPFQEVGKVITGLYETNESTVVHTPNDVIARMSPNYVYEVTKAATGAVLHFSGAYQINTSSEGGDELTVNIYPNPAFDRISWSSDLFNSPYQLSIYNSKGEQKYFKSYNAQDPCQADISHLNPGLLFLKFDQGNGITAKVSKIIKVNKQ